MRALTLALLLSFAVAAGSLPARAQVAPSRPAQLSSIDTAIAKVEPSLVRIHVVSVDFQDGREVKREASGSGTIISPDGFVLTNHHVAGRTRAIICTLADREEMPAKLVGTDPLKKLIQEHARVAEMLACCLDEGMRTLKMDGMEKVLMGLTDIPTVRAVCIK